MSNFDDLHSHKYDDQVQFYAFGLLAGNGEAYRTRPLSIRKATLVQLLAAGHLPAD